MANTTRTYTGDGSRVLYPIDFELGYIKRGYVYVYSGDDYTTQLNYTWQNANEIELDTPVANGETFTIRRVVPRDKLVNDYADNAILKEKNLDDSYLQPLMILEEIADGYITTDGSNVVYGDLTIDSDLTIDGGVVVGDDSEINGNLDLLNHKIKNLVKATDPTDAVNLQQVSELLFTTGIDGVIPVVAPKQLGDGITTTFSTPASGTQNNNASSFWVHVAGVYYRPQTDFTIDQTTGNITFVVGGVPTAPVVGAEIDITYFNPIAIDSPDTAVVTATGTTTPRSLADWTSKETLTYNTVVDAKADIKLDIGQHVETVGRRHIFDGAGARYTVVAGGTGTDDGGYYHDLDNGNQLRLIVNGPVNILVFGVLRNGVDQTDRIQAAHDADLGDYFYPAGVYGTTKAIKVKSNTTVRGVRGQSIISPLFSYTGQERFDGACFRNENFEATELTDENITFIDMSYDFTVRHTAPEGGQEVGMFIRYATNVKVIRCQQREGANMHAFLFCVNTESNSNNAIDCRNSAYDHFSSAGSILVTNCTTDNPNTGPSHSIMVTGDDTDIYTSALLGTGLSNKAIISNNICKGASKSQNAGILINNLTAGSQIRDVLISNNYVDNYEFGIALQGDTANVVISGGIVKDCLTQGILIFGEDTPPKNVKVTGVLLDNAGVNSIDVVQGDTVVVSDCTITGTGNVGLRFGTGATNCEGFNNTIEAGAVAKAKNDGTNNLLRSPHDGLITYSNATIAGLPAASNTYQDLDLSSIVGSRRALCKVRIANATGGAGQFSLRTKGSSTVQFAMPFGFGLGVCDIQNSESGIVMVTTDNNGFIQWASSQTGTTGITIESYEVLHDNNGY